MIFVILTEPNLILIDKDQSRYKRAQFSSVRRILSARNFWGLTKAIDDGENSVKSVHRDTMYSYNLLRIWV